MSDASDRFALSKLLSNRFSLADRFSSTTDRYPGRDQPARRSPFDELVQRFVTRELPNRWFGPTGTADWEALESQHHPFARQLADELKQCCSLLTKGPPRFRFLRRQAFRKDVIRLKREFKCLQLLIERSMASSICWAGRVPNLFMQDRAGQFMQQLHGDRGMPIPSYRAEAPKFPSVTRPPPDLVGELVDVCDDLAIFTFLWLQTCVDRCIFGLADIGETTARFCYPITACDGPLSWLETTASLQVEHALHVQRISSPEVLAWDHRTKLRMPSWARDLLWAPLAETLLWEPVPRHGVGQLCRVLIGDLESARVIARSRSTVEVQLPRPADSDALDPAILFGNVVLCGWDESDLEQKTRWERRVGRFYSPDPNDSQDTESFNSSRSRFANTL